MQPLSSALPEVGHSPPPRMIRTDRFPYRPRCGYPAEPNELGRAPQPRCRLDHCEEADRLSRRAHETLVFPSKVLMREYRAIAHPQIGCGERRLPTFDEPGCRRHYGRTEMVAT